MSPKCTSRDIQESPSHVFAVAASDINSGDSHAFGLSYVIDIDRFFSLDKLLRVTSYVKIFISRLRKCRLQPVVLTAEDVIDAELSWSLDVQRRYFSKEVSGQATNLVKQLRLFLDENSVLRTKHRLDNASLLYLTKFPILLPPQDSFTTLLIRKAHSKMMHAGIAATVTHLRQTHWIPKLRQRVKSVLRQCVTCLKINGRPYAAPVQPPLPACRLREAPPFTFTGVDFTGALYYSNGQSKSNKCYICLFTCAVTRNIHLELVVGMSTGAFFRAFQRFTSRRSTPAQIISDNSTTFVSAADYIKTTIEAQPFQEYLASQRRKWTFIPKRAPWVGGFYERLIGITKTAIRKAVGRLSLSLDELQTILVRAESVINARPLTTVSDGAEDPLPLTPAHLLYGWSITSIPTTSLDDDELKDPSFMRSPQDARQRLRRLENVIVDFWLRWKREYLPLLREQHEHTRVRRTTTKNKVRVGDVVLMHSDTDKRIHWPLARVTELVRGADGLVRSAVVQLQNGSKTNRPVTKLYPLELSVSPTDEAPDAPVTTQPDDSTTKRSRRKAAEDALYKIQLHSFLDNSCGGGSVMECP